MFICISLKNREDVEERKFLIENESEKQRVKWDLTEIKFTTKTMQRQTHIIGLWCKISLEWWDSPFVLWNVSLWLSVPARVIYHYALKIGGFVFIIIILITIISTSLLLLLLLLLSVFLNTSVQLKELWWWLQPLLK